MEVIREKLEVASIDAFEDLRHSVVGTEEYDSALKAVETLAKLKIAEYQAEADVTHKDEERRIAEERNEAEIILKEKQAKRDKWQLGISLASLGITAGTYVWGLKRITKFEDVGVVTSKVFNQLPKLTNLFNKK